MSNEIAAGRAGLPTTRTRDQVATPPPAAETPTCAIPMSALQPPSDAAEFGATQQAKGPALDGSCASQTAPSGATVIPETPAASTVPTDKQFALIQQAWAAKQVREVKPPEGFQSAEGRSILDTPDRQVSAYALGDKLYVHVTSFGPGELFNPNPRPSPWYEVDVSQITASSGAKVDPRITQAVNTLGFKLQGALSKPGESNVVSGASVAILLAMMTNGSSDSEAKALISGLGLEGMSAKDVNAGFKALASQLTQGSDGVKYGLANSVWGDTRKFPLDAGFVKRVEAEFGAQARNTKLADATDEINGWVEQATNGMIKDFVNPDLLADCYFAAMNAIHFKGTWQTPFSPQMTWTEPFTKADGTETQVDMMTNDDVKGQGRQGPGFHAAKLPFGKDGTSSLVVWVPDSGDTRQLVKDLATAEGQKSLLSGFTEMSGEVKLPKFETEADSDILAAFEKLGIAGAGPFSKVGPAQASFDVIKQKAKIVVNEEGAEAAAVTGGFGLESVYIPPQLLRADKPFAYAILDEKTQLVSFSGTFEG